MMKTSLFTATYFPLLQPTSRPTEPGGKSFKNFSTRGHGYCELFWRKSTYLVASIGEVWGDDVIDTVDRLFLQGHRLRLFVHSHRVERMKDGPEDKGATTESMTKTTIKRMISNEWEFWTCLSDLTITPHQSPSKTTTPPRDHEVGSASPMSLLFTQCCPSRLCILGVQAWQKARATGAPFHRRCTW